MKPSNSIKDAKKTTKGVKRSNSGLTWSRMPKRSKNDGKIRRNGNGFARTQINLTAVFQKVPTGYIGFVQELPGANTQGATLKEARENLQEAILLVLEANRILADESISGKHSVYINRVAKKTSTVPRHREINEFLARKICRDLDVPEP